MTDDDEQPELLYQCLARAMYSLVVTAVGCDSWGSHVSLLARKAQPALAAHVQPHTRCQVCTYQISCTSEQGD